MEFDKDLRSIQEVRDLIEQAKDGPEAALQSVLSQEGTRFSPMVTAFLSEDNLRRDLAAILTADDAPFYREIYDAEHAV